MPDSVEGQPTGEQTGEPQAKPGGGNPDQAADEAYPPRGTIGEPSSTFPMDAAGIVAAEPSDWSPTSASGDAEAAGAEPYRRGSTQDAKVVPVTTEAEFHDSHIKERIERCGKAIDGKFERAKGDPDLRDRFISSPAAPDMEGFVLVDEPPRDELGTGIISEETYRQIIWRPKDSGGTKDRWVHVEESFVPNRPDGLGGVIEGRAHATRLEKKGEKITLTDLTNGQTTKEIDHSARTTSSQDKKRVESGLKNVIIQTV